MNFSFVWSSLPSSVVVATGDRGHATRAFFDLGQGADALALWV
jgi:hypothetical protein